MCFNMVIYCKSLCELTDGAIEIVVRKLVYNNDGFLVYATRGKRVIKYERTLSIKQVLATLTTLPPFTLLHVHFRMASSGTISHENVHGWKVGGLVVSHNGSVLEYVSVGGKSDTRMLVEDVEFRKAVESRKWDKVAEVIENRRFWGIMFLTAPKEVYVVARCKSFYFDKDDEEDIVAVANDYIGGKTIEPGIYMLNRKTLSLEKLAETKCPHYYVYDDDLVKKHYQKSVFWEV